jgi:hypothetical protein
MQNALARRATTRILGFSEKVRKEDINARGRIALRRILEKYDGTVRTGFIWLRIGSG